MANTPINRNRLEISSDQLKAELSEIKDRVGALETIASIANRAVVEKFVREHLTSDKRKLIMSECESPRTRKYLKEKFDFNSSPALGRHLDPLREADLLRQHFDDDGTQTFEWSNLFRRLPKSTLKDILNVSA